ERARHPERSALMAPPLCDVLAEQDDATRRRRINAGNDIEQCRLAGTVRPDDRLAVAWHDLQSDVARGVQAAEALAQPSKFKRRYGLAIRLGIGAHAHVLIRLEEIAGAPNGSPGDLSLFAEFAGREIAAIDRLRQELVLPVSPELGDVRVGLDHSVP